MTLSGGIRAPAGTCSSHVSSMSQLNTVKLFNFASDLFFAIFARQMLSQKSPRKFNSSIIANGAS